MPSSCLSRCGRSLRTLFLVGVFFALYLPVHAATLVVNSLTDTATGNLGAGDR